MAHVIGMHTLKGNSNISHGAQIKQGQIMKEGEAVAIESYDPIVVAKLAAGNKFAGYVCNINKDGNSADVVIGSAGVALPADAGWTIGDVVSISLTTGMIGTGATGERKTNGVIVDSGVTVIDGKTGEESQGVVVRFGMAEDLGAV